MVFYLLVFVIVVLALTWVFQGNDFFMYKYFAPKQAAAERQVFEQTRSWNAGMVQELQNMRFDYIKTPDKNAKDALASIILHRTSGFNMEDPIVPADLRSFIAQLTKERMEAR